MPSEMSIGLNVDDRDDSSSTGTTTPRPPTPTPAPPRTPPPLLPKAEFKDPPDNGHDKPVLAATDLVTFDRGAKHASDGCGNGLEGLNLHPLGLNFDLTEDMTFEGTTEAGAEEPSSTGLESRFEGYTPAEVYDLNQQLLNSSIPDVPLITELAPMASLRAEYENGSASFLSQIDWLVNQGYTSIRRARGDGDCFYRSLAFAYIEHLLQGAPQDLDLDVASSLSVLSSGRQLLDKIGVESIVVDDPYETFSSVIQNITTPNSKGQRLTLERLLARFQAQSPEPEDEEESPVSANIVFYLRMLIRAHLQINKGPYDGFCYDADTGESLTVESFCRKYVDPVGSEADHIQMTAVCRELGVNLDVAYLDGRAETVKFVHLHEGPEGQKPITLLYRPGHYDILVKGDGGIIS